MVNNILNISLFYLGLFGYQTKDICFFNSFREWQMYFPASVGVVVRAHQMDFKPPGFYYKNLSKDNGEVILTYKFKLTDFSDETQTRETLFPRELDSYIFRFPEKPGLQDSLRRELEKIYRKKFHLIKASSSL